MSLRNPEEGAEVKSPQVGLRLPRVHGTCVLPGGEAGPRARSDLVQT